MRSFLIAVAVCLSSCTFTFGADPTPAPELKFHDLAGKEHSLAEYKGKKAVVIDFWASWCGPCRQSLPVVEKVAGKFKDKPVQFLAINLGEPRDTVRRFARNNRIGLTIRCDYANSAPQKFNFRGIPHLVIVDAAGNIQYVHSGASPTLEKDLTDAVNKVLDSK